MGDIGGGAAAYARALGLAPDFREAWLNLAQARKEARARAADPGARGARVAAPRLPAGALVHVQAWPPRLCPRRSRQGRLASRAEQAGRAGAAQASRLRSAPRPSGRGERVAVGLG